LLKAIGTVDLDAKVKNGRSEGKAAELVTRKVKRERKKGYCRIFLFCNFSRVLITYETSGKPHFL